jgi:hypothetical protein
MKGKLLIHSLFICAAIICFAKPGKAQELQFDYDAAGNQIKRNWVCVNCTTFPVSLVSRDNSSELSTITDVKKNTASTQRNLLAYPNPVTEVLNVKWEANDKSHITKIEVSTATGVIFFTKEYPYLESVLEQVAISFQKQVPGMYILRATYNDGKQEIIKVIKK